MAHTLLDSNVTITPDFLIRYLPFFIICRSLMHRHIFTGGCFLTVCLVIAFIEGMFFN